ncbi:NADH-quinone oxidoreductase subunit D [Nymphon striatum]|nr:NADH-quinone oxidoreductase subunit D [Nymphon striatum]
MDGSKGFEDALTGEQKIRNFNINFGPQHPAAHGVLRLVLELDGEIVERCDPHIGLLHRGTEKLMESRTYLQNLPYFDRLDYVAPMNQEHAWCLAIEKLTGTPVPRRASLIRVLYSEIGRILNHLLNITTQALDVGALTPPLWGFEEREKLMVFYERACGARLHAAYFRPGGVHQDLPPDLIDDIETWATEFPNMIADIDGLLSENRIFKQRNVDIGVISEQDILDYGFSGVMVRGSGLAWDLRRSQPYECYDEFDFQIPVGKNGDCFDRYLVRMEEMRQSLRIIHQAIEKLRAPEGQGDVLARGKAFTFPKAKCTARLKAPKGEFGVYLVADGSNKPYRAKIRAPGFLHLQAMDYIATGPPVGRRCGHHRHHGCRVRGDRPMIRPVGIALAGFMALSGCLDIPPQGVTPEMIAEYDAAVASIGCDMVGESDYQPVELQTGLTREQVIEITEYKLARDEAVKRSEGGVRITSGACA